MTSLSCTATGALPMTPPLSAGVAWLRDMPVTAIAIEKGKDLTERFKRNFGSPMPEGYRKALRLMKQAEKFHRPVVSAL